MSTNPEFYSQMLRIRRFEETVLENFSRGIFSGTTHTYSGQEANAVGVLSNVQPGDVVVSNHRCHGHFLAYGGDMRALFAELMGRLTGVCGGRGGSQHLCWRSFYSNGVLGGMVPVATGMALAEKYQGTQAVVVAFMGDGTLGEGVVYEALNMASLFKAPVLYVVENNHIAQTTPTELTLAGAISDRFQAFRIPVSELDTSDVLPISRAAEGLIAEIRRDQAPRALILNTQRFGPHSKGDDTRPAEAIQRLRLERDPLVIHAQQLDAQERTIIESRVNDEVTQAYNQALADPYPVPTQDLRIAEPLEQAR
jgi:TPP-dependent pyruvate/acetoin dehydrogenase alpha subunit